MLTSAFLYVIIYLESEVNNMNIELTENSYAFQSAKRLAEEALNRCLKKLKDNENKWNESLNLKLYDCAYMKEFETDFGKIVLNDDIASNAFYAFCESSYDMMLEDLRESNDINFVDIADYIGTTSSFYISDAHNNEKDKYIIALAELSYTFKNFNESQNLDEILLESKTKQGYYEIQTESTPEEYLEQCLNDFLDIAQNVEKEFEEAFHEIELVYDYITDFKKNQVEYFTDYVKDYIQTW